MLLDRRILPVPLKSTYNKYPWEYGTTPLSFAQSSQYDGSHYPSTPTTLSTSQPKTNGYEAYTASSSGYPQPTPTDGAITHAGKGFSKEHIIIAALLPVVFFVTVGGALLCCLRRRRRRRAQPCAVHETKVPEARVTDATKGPSAVTFPAPPFLQPSTATAFSQPSQPEEHPIILSPLNQSNRAYYTGLDTSDVMSVVSTGTRTTQIDEPPPPYRPRSIAVALSRDSSVRHPPQQVVSASSSKGESSMPNRSPFADPDEEDTISELSESPSGSRLRREDDEFSAVSDLVYQQDSTGSRTPTRRQREGN